MSIVCEIFVSFLDNGMRCDFEIDFGCKNLVFWIVGLMI